MIQRMLAIWSLVPLPFLKPAWMSGSSRFTYCWSLAWRILSITLLACEMNAVVQLDFPKEMEQCLLSFGWKRLWSQNSMVSHVLIRMRRQRRNVSDAQVLRIMGTLLPFWCNRLKKPLGWMREKKKKSVELWHKKSILISEASKIWHCSCSIHLCQ